MIKVEYLSVYNFQAAVRGMRNPMNSWEKSDSLFRLDNNEDDVYSLDCYDCLNNYVGIDSYDLNEAGVISIYENGGGNISAIGPNDFDLMKKLTKAGTEHRKFLRQIFVSMDITAPLYWWKEFDTYKVGTTANSCSTMHKIHSKEFTLDDFSTEHLIDRREIDQTNYALAAVTVNGETALYTPRGFLSMACNVLNYYRNAYLETKDKKYWWQMIQLLPSSYNQRRTISMNYENVLTILHQRSGHKLDEWNELCDIFRERLPLIKELEEAMK